MRIIRTSGITAFLLTALFISCTKEDAVPEGGTRFKVFQVCLSSAATRSEVSGGTVKWNEADKLYYYTGKTGAVSGDIGTCFIPKEGRDPVKFSVIYKDGDENIVFFTKGSSTGDCVSPTMTGFTLDNGIPSSQDGTFDSNHISAVKVSLSKNTATLFPCQAFLEFYMDTLSFGDKTVNYIEISGSGGNEYLCGKLTLTPGESSVGVSSAPVGKTIVIDKVESSFFARQNYYVAIRVPEGTASDPGYSNGLTINMYHATKTGGTVTSKDKLATVLTGSISPAKGKILNLGNLQTNKHVPFKSFEMFPTYAAFTKDMPDGKKIWIKVVPSDYDGEITWTSSNSKIKVTGIVKDTLPDIGECYVGLVMPDGIEDYEKYTADIVATLGNKEGTASQECTCKVEIGKWIYMGGKESTTNKKVLWSIGTMMGNAGSLYLNTDPYSISGKSYDWGTLVFEKTWTSGDIAAGLESGCHTPSAEDWTVLSSGANASMSYGKKGDYYYSKYSCKVKGYTDMYLIMPAHGHNGGSINTRWTYECRSATYYNEASSKWIGCMMRSGMSGTSGIEKAFTTAVLENGQFTTYLRPVKYVD